MHSALMLGRIPLLNPHCPGLLYRESISLEQSLNRDYWAHWSERVI
jgi:hypothetical protein